MAILLLADHDNEALSDQTARALTAAGRIGGEVHVLVAGLGAERVAAEAAGLEGVSRVLLAEDARLANGLAEPLATLLLGLSGGYDTLVSAATAVGKSVMPRVAALLDVAQISEITEVVGPDTFRRPIYAGNAIETVQSTDPVRIVTVRTAAFPPAPRGGDPVPVEGVAAPPDAGLSSFIGRALSRSDRPELASARVVVSGGRGLGSAEAFGRVVLPLADALGAAVGASRAAVDAGYAPNDWQVGQTGKVVAPELYIAAGISGAIQHLAGMKDSKVIVAINKDGDAPIFQVADYGLVGDLFEIVPELTAALADGGHQGLPEAKPGEASYP